MRQTVTFISYVDIHEWPLSVSMDCEFEAIVDRTPATFDTPGETVVECIRINRVRCVTTTMNGAKLSNGEPSNQAAAITEIHGFIRENERTRERLERMAVES